MRTDVGHDNGVYRYQFAEFPKTPTFRALPITGTAVGRACAWLYAFLTTKDYRVSRVYRTKNSLKIFCFVFLAFSLLFGFGAWRGLSTGANTWLDLMIAIVLILVGAGFAAQTFTARIVLTEDSIRYGSVFRSHSMHLKQVRYRREYEEYQDGAEGGINVPYLELIPSHGETQSLKIPKNDFDLDNAFWEWILRIPEFDDLQPSQLR
jgi:hypothetical protein